MIINEIKKLNELPLHEFHTLIQHRLLNKGEITLILYKLFCLGRFERIGY